MRRCVAALALAGWTCAALGVEQTVQNDSFVSGGQAIIEAGFAAGESAAAWLTSPCDGNIVALQVAWMSQNGGSGSTIEDSITVFDGGTFPNPGAQLAVLQSPNMTDGFINEFRYLDEGNTIPISIPVTRNQVFVVSFKFANPPPPSGPSVIVDTDGCQSGKNAIFAIPPSMWFDSCALGVSGDFVIRAVVDCGAVSGACCMPDGSCTVKSPANCSSAGGTYQGDNTSCASVQCPQPTGACCIDQTQGCLVLTQANCSTVGGRWGGAGTNCSTYVCFPHGACCKPDGSCVDNLSPSQCAALNGTFEGNATHCSSVNCPPPTGACCLSNGGCLVLSLSDCTIVAGTWAGPQTTCAICPNVRRGDMNCDHVVNFADINPFVLALSNPAGYRTAFPTCPIMNADCDGNGLVNFGDINPFVALLSHP